MAVRSSGDKIHHSVFLVKHWLATERRQRTVLPYPGVKQRRVRIRAIVTRKMFIFVRLQIRIRIQTRRCLKQIFAESIISLGNHEAGVNGVDKKLLIQY